jgi:hypothetical protein
VKFTKYLFQLVINRNLFTVISNRLRVRRGRLPRLLPYPMRLTNKEWSARRINKLLNEIPFAKNYLEIGLSAGKTFQNVNFSFRVGVDPHPLFALDRLPKQSTVFPIASDDFFAICEESTFDLVFIDGLHTFEQTYRDLIHSLELCPTGLILIDDVVPSDEFSAMRDQMDSQALRKKAGISGSSWHGDVFKVILCLSDHHPDLSVRTIVGSGNPQTLVWRKKLGTKIESVKKFQLDKYMSIKYQDVFLDGPPDCFFVCSEEDAIRDATFGIRSQITFS